MRYPFYLSSVGYAVPFSQERKKTFIGWISLNFYRTVSLNFPMLMLIEFEVTSHAHVSSFTVWILDSTEHFLLLVFPFDWRLYTRT
jgi:hypothetical protein